MTSLSLHPTPSLRTVTREQVRVSGLLLRKGGVLMLALYLLAMVGLVIQVKILLARGGARQVASANFTFTPQISIVVMLIALLLPLMLWEGEDPTRRSYQWLMPLPRHTHTLARAFAGWIWLMVATALFLLGTLALVAITERLTGVPQAYHAGFVAWEWLVPFTSATVAYLFASAAAVGTRRPLVWVFGVPALYALCVMMLMQLHMPQLGDALHTWWAGSYGARSAMAGAVMGSHVSGAGEAPEFTRWLAATALWGALGGSLLAYASLRHQDAR